MVIVDKFHVIQLVTKALESERKAFRATLDAKRRSKLLKERFLLLRNHEDLETKDIWQLDNQNKNSNRRRVWSRYSTTYGDIRE